MWPRLQRWLKPGGSVVVFAPERHIGFLIERNLTRQGYDASAFTDPADALVWIGERNIQLAIIHFRRGLEGVFSHLALLNDQRLAPFKVIGIGNRETRRRVELRGLTVDFWESINH